jgi:hypothetical protein
MEGISLYQGIVKGDIFGEFVEQKGISLFNHAANCCTIDDFLSIAYVLCPDIIEVNGYIFISDLFDAEGTEAIEKVRRLEQQFGNDKRKVEQWVNSRSLGDFFIGSDYKSMDNERVLEQFGEVLKYNWTRRLKELFPQREIVVEIGNGIMGEYGPTVTVYEL